MRYRIPLVCAAIVVLGWLFTVRVSWSMPDLEVYWRGAGRAAAAEPLYRPEDGHFQFKYLPAFAVLTIPLSFLPLEMAKAVWFACSVALLGLLIAISLELLPERRRSTRFLVVAAIVVLGKFFAHEIVLGQVNILFTVLAAAAFLAMRADREIVAGVLIALTIAIKPYGILFVPWLFARGKTTSVATVCLGMAAVILVPAAIYGIQDTISLYWGWWNTVSQTTPSNLLNADNVSFAGMYAKWLGPGLWATSLALLTTLLSLGAAALMFFRRRSIHFPEGLEGSLLLMLVPLLSPQGWDYVLLTATPAVVYLANYYDRLPVVPRVAAIVAALTIGLSLFDVMGRTAYHAFMGMALVSVCAIVLVAAVCTIRVNKIA